MDTTELKYFFKYAGISLILCASINLGSAQQINLTGSIVDEQGTALSYATIALEGTSYGTSTDENGTYILTNINPGQYTLVASYIGHSTYTEDIELSEGASADIHITLIPSDIIMDELVISGTMKQVQRSQSPVPVEVYTTSFFKKNPTSNMFEALQNLNGVRPQINCSVCNTGDIQINGLDGPYTMILIDGMPIVSSLATVYGLSGIPSSLIDRMEVVKGPASSLYGSEAIGGLINIITKTPETADQLSVDVMTTSWLESNIDLGTKVNLGDLGSVLLGANYFNYDEIIDNNDDNFTDLTLQERVSIFQKWDFNRKDNKITSLGARYYWEDRWGGETQWTQADRGGSEVYGEAITTKRWELIGKYQLPTEENFTFSTSLNGHRQSSAYGDVPYVAEQNIAFGQLTWDKYKKGHDLLVGIALRYTYYDDNTPATGGDIDNPANNPDKIWLPGIFVQDEISFSSKHKLLAGFRYDYNNHHGSILTPRLAYKWNVTDTDIFRINIGTGFRVVNLFTEDHAFLTGARDIIIAEELNPESSFNTNVNYTKRLYLDDGSTLGFELSGWYTYFNNVILPDYETDPNLIIYDNLDGYGETKGISFNADIDLASGLTITAGATLQDVSTVEDGIRNRQILTERFTSTWSISYPFLNKKLQVDYTGNLYSPMELPLLGALDPRPSESPWWSIQNIQLSFKGSKDVEIYGGVKNILNWTPWSNQEEPIISRAFDPFDRDVQFDGEGQVIPTPSNPHALTFDPTYVYAPNQGRRAFVGVRYRIN